MQPPSRNFPTTRWSRLLAGAQADARASLELLAQRYLAPIEAYARALTGMSAEEAREAGQDFFLWILESGFLDKADPARGSFRGFIKRCLANFLQDRGRRMRTARKGGQRTLHSLEALPSPAAELADPAGRAADQVLDDLWRRTLLAQAAEDLEADLRRRGKERTFAVFRDYYLGDEDLDHAALAARHGVSVHDVSNLLDAAKKRYRVHLRTAVRDTVQQDDDLRAELRWLFEDPAP